METSRRSFIKNISLTVALIAAGGVKFLSAAEAGQLSKKAILRFALASDGHYGQPGTAYDDSFNKMVAEINKFHKQSPLHCCIINGDIIHNEKKLLPQSKQFLDQLTIPYYVAKGNHDMVSDEYWKEVWGTLPNHVVNHKKNTFIIANTSNEKGDYLSPDLNWLKLELDAASKQKNIFLVLHIPQKKWTANAIDTPAFFELIDKYSNIRAVFHGHEHDQDNVKMYNKLPFLFDSHFGGNWGTPYQGFRVVELMEDNSILTYMMNPVDRLYEQTYV